MKRAALYVRVSTEEQKKHGISVDAQIEALKTYCAKEDLIVAGIYNDAGISGRKRYTKRPALLQLIKDCEDEKIDIILFTKLDRWFRSVADYYEVQSKLEKTKVPWRAIQEDYETETSSGVFKVNIMLSVSQSEADRASERVKATFNYKRERGEFVSGTPPFGYSIIDKRLQKNNDAPTVELIFDTYLKTLSVSKTLRTLIDNGTPQGEVRIKRMLKNPTYYGDAHGHKCEPYITKEQFDIIQDSRKKRTRETKQKHQYIFSALPVCGYCGAKMAGLTNTHKKKNPVIYYRCNSRKVDNMFHKFCSISENRLEKYLLDNLDNILKEYSTKTTVKSQEKEFQALKKKKANLQSRLDRVGERYELGDISRDEYMSKRDSLLEEINSISFEPPKDPPKLPKSWKEVYLSLDKSAKRVFWMSFIDKIIVTAETRDNPEIIFK